MAAQDIINAYEAKLGRPPDARELESALENDAKYGHQQLLDELDRRAGPTASNGGSGGDLDLDGDARIDEGWIRIGDEGGGRWTQDADFAARYQAADPNTRDAMIDALRAGGSTSRGAAPGGGLSSGSSVSGGAGGGFSGGSVGGGGTRLSMMGLSPVEPYRPFTETFQAPSPRALPTWDKTFAAPTRPGDLDDAWAGGEFSFDPSRIKDNPAYQVRLADMIRAVERSASARGVTFTPHAREELLHRAGALASTELESEFGRQLGTHQTNFGNFTTDKSRRAAEASRIFDEALAGYQQGRGEFESDRGFAAGENDLDWNRSRVSFLDRANIHNVNETGRFGAERANLLDTRGWDSELWGRDRTDRNDQWGRGMDVWGMQRTDRNDLFDQNFRLSDLVLRERPRPR